MPCNETNPCGCPVIHDERGSQYCPECLGACEYCDCLVCQRYWWEYSHQHTLAVCVRIPFAPDVKE